MPLSAQHMALGVSWPRPQAAVHPPAQWFRGWAGLRPCPRSPGLGRKGMLWFRAGQRQAAKGSCSCHCLSVPGCQGTSWVLLALGSSGDRGAQEDSCQGTSESNALKTSLRGPGVLLRCPEPQIVCFSYILMGHLSGTVLRHLFSKVHKPVG